MSTLCILQPLLLIWIYVRVIYLNHREYLSHVLDDQSAIKSLQNALSGIEKIKYENPHSANHIKWVSDTLYLLEEIFGRKSRIYFTIASLTWQPSGTSFVASMYNIDEELKRRQYTAYLQQLEISKPIQLKNSIWLNQ